MRVFLVFCYNSSASRHNSLFIIHISPFMLYDLAIIGGGPAGVAAGVYASRKRLRTLFLTRDWGGQSFVSPEIQNWIGTIKISGLELADMLKKHLEAYAGEVVDIKDGEEVANITRDGEWFVLEMSTGGAHRAKTLLLTSGSRRRKLEVPNADKFEHNGVTYCASCDGPFFAGMDVAVIGGGNAGFETAAELLAYTKSVTLLNRSDEFKADPVTVKKVLSNPKMHALLNADIKEVLGEKNVTGLTYRSKETGEKKTLPVQGIFVEIGSVPNTDFVKGIVALDEWRRVITDPRNQRTKTSGIWAAGDCTDTLYHQNNIAAGDGVRALEDIYLFIHAAKV